MTEKRFIVKNIMFDRDCIVDTTDESYYTTDKQDLENLCEVLNELADENEQLRKENQTLIKGIQDPAKQGAETIIKVWESKNQPKTIKRGYYD